jgi:hypothetical protein
MLKTTVTPLSYLRIKLKKDIEKQCKNFFLVYPLPKPQNTCYLYRMPIQIEFWFL